MAEQPEEDFEANPRRFVVALFIVHPNLDPAEITAALELKPSHFQRAGNPRRTPKGDPLPGVYRDTRWRHKIEVELKDQHFSKEVVKLVDRLEPHRLFLHKIGAAGGKAAILLQFFDAYYGDQIDKKILSRLVDLGLDLSIEFFSVPQG